MSARDVGMLALRLGLGGSLIGHGTQKLFGWFGGHGLAGTGQFMAKNGFVPGPRNALIAGLTETGGGLALALGFGTGPAAGAVASTMTVAGSTSAKNGFFAQGGGFELSYVYALAAASLALTGPGRLSLDEASGHLLRRPWMTALSFGAGAVAAYVLITRAARTRAAEAEPTTAEG